jgi:hypothetical protein
LSDRPRVVPGARTPVADVLGLGWAFGAWLDEELAWLANACEGLETTG